MTQSSNFVQVVTVTKDKMPCIILYTEEQINLISNFCFRQPQGSVLGVDRTYNLGQIFVTCTVFKHKSILRRSTDEEPIVTGPVFACSFGL
jgi:hypothetical protein